jgi:CheY-like chemotaxis protein
VLVAANAAAAIEIIERGHQIDLLFTDVAMPGGRTAASSRRRPCAAGLV